MKKRTTGGQFAKGHSGNKSGKPKGTRNKTTLAALSLIEGEAEALSRKAIEMALEGDTTALRLCLERIAPPTKERPLSNFELPSIENMKGVLTAIELIAHRLTEGKLLPSEAKAICNVLEQYRKHFEMTELQTRLEEVENTLKLRKLD